MVITPFLSQAARCPPLLVLIIAERPRPCKSDLPEDAFLLFKRKIQEKCLALFACLFYNVK